MNVDFRKHGRILFYLAAGAVAVFQARGATVMVEMRDLAFDPPAVTISAGDTVVWTNEDLVEHSTTSGTPEAPDGNWNSGLLGMGAMFSRAFPTAGTFPYFCMPHPFMTGTVTVQGGASAVTVNITSPANGTVIEAPGNVTVEATATSSGGTITQVEFFDGTESLGVDTMAPFRVTAAFGAGTHSLTAEATDSTGASAVSPVVAVTVNGGGVPIENPIPDPIAKGDITIELEMILEGLVSPLGMAAPDDDTGRLFVYDQVGVVHVVSEGAKLETPLLDVRNRLVALNSSYDERGLLGLATHPDFAEHPLVYTYTSEPNGPMADFMIMIEPPGTNNHQSVIAEWRIDPANPNVVDPASRREILRLDKPQGNHNGGTMRFGPDGLLYIAIGDGGAADDQGDGHSPGGNGQDRSNILGTVIRIDVDARTSANGAYGVPEDNPFVGQAGIVPEIYAWGLRNPYSFSFDSENGELLLADVGQNDIEEIDKIAKGGNYGWRIKEGSFFFDPNGGDDGFVTTMPVVEAPPDLIDPIAEFDHDEGAAVVGGYVARGGSAPGIEGKYVFGSWGEFSEPSGRLFYLEGGVIKEFRIGMDDRALGQWLKGFGEDQDGNLYVFGSTELGPSGTSGQMLKIVGLGAELKITGVVRNGTTLTISWEGGSAPYEVQMKTDVAAAEWTTALTTSEASAEIPMEGSAGYFQIASGTDGP